MTVRDPYINVRHTSSPSKRQNLRGAGFCTSVCLLNQQAGKEARRVADEAAATGHSKLLALQQKQEEVLADMQAAQRDQQRWRAQWEAQKQALQQEHDTLQRSIQASLRTTIHVYATRRTHT